MSIHQELQRKARWLPRSVGRSAVVRFARFVDRFPRRSSLQKNGLSIEEYLLPGRGQARVRVIAPSQPSAVPRPAVLWIHGGGYVIGRAALDDHIAMNFARKLNVVVVAADYRLAPEHPYPIPLQDCYAAYQWLHSEAGRLGLDVEQVVVAGQSAGGGLAAALVQLLHDRQDPQPVLQLLVYPMLDDRTCLRSLEQRDFRLWDQKSNRFGWRSYLGHEPGTNAVETYAVPARRGDLRGLPMTCSGAMYSAVPVTRPVSVSLFVTREGCRVMLYRGNRTIGTHIHCKSKDLDLYPVTCLGE